MLQEMRFKNRSQAKLEQVEEELAQEREELDKVQGELGKVQEVSDLRGTGSS